MQEWLEKGALEGLNLLSIVFIQNPV